jgi:cytosine/creatinine deaminase
VTSARIILVSSCPQRETFSFVSYHETEIWAQENPVALRILDFASSPVLSGRMRDRFLQAAIDEARQGLAEGGIPIGSVIVHHGGIIGRGHNMRVQKGDPLLHGEMSAFQDAGRQPASVYRESVLYTTLSPCPMCSGASLLYKIPKIVIGENQTFLGAEDWLRSHGVELDVIQDDECIAMMRKFIAERPELWNEDIAV